MMLKKIDPIVSRKKSMGISFYIWSLSRVMKIKSSIRINFCRKMERKKRK